MWTLSTSGKDEPNGIPMIYHTVLDDGKLIMCDVFSTTSVENLQNCGRVCVSAFGMEHGPEGYKLYGNAQFHKEGIYAEIAEKMSAASLAEKGFTAKGGAIVVEVDKILVASPGPNNNKVVE